MAYVDAHVLPGLRAKGLTVVDLRGQLPRNTQYPQLKKWSTRPLSAITLYAWHWPASPVRPPMPYDEVARLAAFARSHSTMDWGNGYRAPTITYHTAIGGSGTLYLLNDWEDATWHASNANGIALGLMVDVGVGQEPTPPQIRTANTLADFVSTECPELPAGQGDHYGHGEPELAVYGNATACPGSLLPYIRAYREHGSMEDDPMVTPEQQTILDEAAKRGIVDGAGLAWYVTFFEISDPEIKHLREMLPKAQGERDAALAEVERLHGLVAELQAQPPASGVERVSFVTRLHHSDGSITHVPADFETHP